jgi:hypothetical protein
MKLPERDRTVFSNSQAPGCSCSPLSAPIALNASAALYRHFWSRDDTLEAMLPAGMRHRVAPGRAHESRSFRQR